MQIYHWVNVFLPQEDTLVKKYLGSDTPNLRDIIKNMSVYLVNKPPALTYANSENPNVIFYHGSHIATTPPALSEVYIIFSRYFQTMLNNVNVAHL